MKSSVLFVMILLISSIFVEGSPLRKHRKRNCKTDECIIINGKVISSPEPFDTVVDGVRVSKNSKGDVYIG